MAATSAEHAPGDIIAKRFRLERKLGEGGMGTVWAATHTITRRKLAVKLLKPRAKAQQQRFMREHPTPFDPSRHVTRQNQFRCDQKMRSDLCTLEFYHIPICSAINNTIGKQLLATQISIYRHSIPSYFIAIANCYGVMKLLPNLHAPQ